MSLNPALDDLEAHANNTRCMAEGIRKGVKRSRSDESGKGEKGAGLVLDSGQGIVGGGGGEKERVRRHQHAQPIYVLMAEFQTLDVNFA
jgi:hypothetical protein